MTPARPLVRTHAGGIGALALATSLAACGGDDPATPEASDLDPDADLSTQSVTVSNWAGYMAEDIGDQFATETGSTLRWPSTPPTRRSWPS